MEQKLKEMSRKQGGDGDAGIGSKIARRQKKGLELLKGISSKLGCPDIQSADSDGEDDLTDLLKAHSKGVKP